MDTILVIEDDPAISLGLQKNLKYEGYDVLTAAKGEVGLEMALDRKPDLIILDVMLPTLSGFEICKTLKRNEVDIPIIILSAKDQEIDKIMGLDLGADDYLTKPFSIRELIARINAVLRRKKRYEKELETFTFGDVSIDFTARTVARGGKPLELSPREFDLLGYFVRHPNEVMDRRQILNKVWGYDYYGTARTIDNFVTKLRQKLEPDAENPSHFVTARGIGYKFVPDK
ncbi:MAG: response regulator transcription factor [Planctomycetes bacterium]|nr:response regulator transcription factor [Planctomycetota bacterium]MCW8141782.1 response regulator transcription factor [Planctomycetota bacterium]